MIARTVISPTSATVIGSIFYIILVCAFFAISRLVIVIAPTLPMTTSTTIAACKASVMLLRPLPRKDSKLLSSP